MQAETSRRDNTLSSTFRISKERAILTPEMVFDTEGEDRIKRNLVYVNQGMPRHHFPVLNRGLEQPF